MGRTMRRNDRFDPADASRRGFMSGAAALLGAATLPAGVLAATAPARTASVSHTAAPSAAPCPGSDRGAEPVVGFHADRPYLDVSGKARPYHPPAGARAGEGLAEHLLGDFIGQFGYC